ncbi:Haem-binding domain-containing protein [Epilithonimonas mollis]|uniref:Haem-binding domain-containing protein n=2 Tax=Flavobacteriales TaxID=200644 RepID=A0A1M6QW52_9FLAO|nr:heme-binding domain-containing protein [Kaistella yonginensis]MDN3607720.1 heme-binding domain-containing protein [Kaistella yonginensis]MDN5578679.1 heme-binding domain-containing protein [Chryseobacterium sp.]SHK24502.1 Haem-binding domain-containing protein [Epilithonimonas mollis]
MIGWLAVLVVAIVLVIQVIPVERNVSTVPPGQSFEKTEKVPANVAAILKVSCYDCHSNNSRYPWYSELQPGAWFMAQHIKKGRDELNFDEFNNYSKRRKKAKIKSIISQIEKDEMPLRSYRMMHGNARLSADEKKELLDFFRDNEYSK